jgi:hypothetical protein
MALVCDTNITLNCDVCYEWTKPYGDLNLSVWLTPATVYYLFVFDRLNNLYRQQVTIAGDGSFTIDATQDPSGLYDGINAGSLQIFLSTDIN